MERTALLIDGTWAPAAADLPVRDPEGGARWRPVEELVVLAEGNR